LNKNKQTGGVRTIPPFIDKHNTTFKSKDKDFKKSSKFSKPNFNQNQPENNDLVSVKISKDLVTNQLNKIPAYRQIYPAPYMPVQYPMPQTPNVAGQFHPYSIGNAPHLFTANNVPIINNYKIDAGGINANHVNIDNIYEDILPVELKYSSFDSLRERLLFYTYMRSTFITFGDGEFINVDQKSSSLPNTLNLLDKVKLMEFNPYNYNKFTTNPYKDLSDRMVLYRSCYPMTFNNTTYSMRCNPNNINLNIRIYDMNVGEVCAKRISENYDWHRFDLWREIGFYEYVREKIIRKNICPHFPIMFAYYVSPNKKIDFEKFRQIKRNYTNPADARKKVEQERVKNKKILEALYVELRKLNSAKNSVITHFPDKNNNNIFIGSYVTCNNSSNNNYKKMGYVSDLIDIGNVNNYDVMIKQINGNVLEANYINIDYKEFFENWVTVNEMQMFVGLSVEQRPNMNRIFEPRNLSELEVVRLMRNINPTYPSEKCLVAITEAYNYPLRMWASRLYEKDLHITNKMIHTGFHSEKVWMTILFQLLAGLTTMYYNNFTIHNMSLDNNIFIKYLGKEDNPSGYWKYIIDNIEYYIPNYGYMVIIDSNYQDLKNDNFTLKVNYDKTRLYQRENPPKIWSSKIFMTDKKNEDCDNTSYIQEDIYYNLINIFDKKNFSSGEHKQYGGIEPPEQIMDVIGNIHNDLTTTKISLKNLFITNFSNFLHNKVGTYITKDESEFVEESELEMNPIIGKLYIDNDDKFILYVGKDTEEVIRPVKEVDIIIEDRPAEESVPVEESAPAEKKLIDSVLINSVLLKKEKIGNKCELVNKDHIGIRKYKSRYPIEQDYKLVDGKFTADKLIDTYIIKK